jgi:hypothetical protein
MSGSSSVVASSPDWYAYFVSNRSSGDDLPWDCSHRLTESERHTILKSVQQFQLGEGAAGRRLLERGRTWSAAVGDPFLVSVLGLFVKEEQRHSQLLSRFMRRERIPELTSHWLDGIFRRIRVLAGLELELRVLVTAEIIAVPYYRALGAATESHLLHSISDTILADEAAHLRFQKTMLCRLGAPHRPALRCLVWQLHRLFLAGTCCVVWMEHRAVFKAAGYSFGKFLEEAFGEISALEASPTVPRARAKTGRATAVAADY